MVTMMRRDFVVLGRTTMLYLLQADRACKRMRGELTPTGIQLFLTPTTSRERREAQIEL